MDIKNELKNIMVDILEVEGDFKEDCSSDDTANWDSVRHLQLVTALEEIFNIQFSMEEVTTMDDFKKIKNLICNKLK